MQLGGNHMWVDDHARVGIDVGERQRDREDLAVAIGNGGAARLRHHAGRERWAVEAVGRCHDRHERGDVALGNSGGHQDGGESELDCDEAEQAREAGGGREQSDSHGLETCALG